MSEELIRLELETLKHDVSQISVDVKAIRDWQLAVRLCPTPGACSPIVITTSDHEKRLRFLERFAYGFLGIIGLINIVIAIAK